MYYLSAFRLVNYSEIADFLVYVPDRYYHEVFFGKADWLSIALERNRRFSVRMG